MRSANVFNHGIQAGILTETDEILDFTIKYINEKR